MVNNFTSVDYLYDDKEDFYTNVDYTLPDSFDFLDQASSSGRGLGYYPAQVLEEL